MGGLPLNARRGLRRAFHGEAWIFTGRNLADLPMTFIVSAHHWGAGKMDLHAYEPIDESEADGGADRFGRWSVPGGWLYERVTAAGVAIVFVADLASKEAPSIATETARDLG